MLFSGNTVLAEPGMVFFLRCLVADSVKGLASSPGHTRLVTGKRREVRPLELIVD
jgi:hypothetical protein